MINYCETCKYRYNKKYEKKCLECSKGNLLNWEPDDVKRPEMLPKIVPIYERESSTVPDAVRVSFEDGSTEIYERRVALPAPVIVENIQIIRKWKQGYVNQPMRRRRYRK